ncbi:putative ABC transport system permease protein [Polymorphobacter multimanifer]|uniref:Putative ABC transport system permease protein n=1 Tax=Polymorphobacter multimanifer TaxID=1070431 RepID=A0A841L690_9SPHN|nr:FtsX-like permease family protein [Polymorphobacter multimanifer]MBB6228117.1 putative ABC transport system permease protein [Polymorphobacter multimanifer]
MSLALSLALRELRGGLQGLRLLAVCLILGVAALAGVGSLSSAISAGLAERGQLILGGDIEARLSGRFATEDEVAQLAALGPVSEVAKLRGMASNPANEERTYAEIKAIDANWPLYGSFRMDGGDRVEPGSVALSTALADKLALRTGDAVVIGSLPLKVGGIIVEEPDKAGDGLGFGPNLLMARADLEATGLLGPGSQYSSRYRVRLPPGTDLAATTKGLEAAAPDAGFQFRDATNGAPSTQRFVNNLGQFLTLVGLTALVVSGVGVAGGVSAYLGARTRTIATLKTLGADSALVRAIYLWQIGLVTLGAIVVGLGLGSLAPWAVASFAADSLPVPPSLTPQWGALAASAAYGLLIALMFALWPLAEAAKMPAARLYRSLTERKARPGGGTIAVIVLAAIAIVAITLLRAGDTPFVFAFLGAAIGLVLLLWALASGVRAVAARAPRPRNMLLRLALGNLHRPGAPTRQLVMALGLGLTLFATLATIESNFSGQINRTIPDKAPSFFVIDVPREGIEGFRTAIAGVAPGAEMTVVPSLRGPVTAVNGVPAGEIKANDEAWILRGDRGLSYAAEFPQANTLVSGTWWPKDYAGPPLISLDDDAAKALGLKIGDSLTVSVLGVEIEAKIASTRKIDWQSLGFNFAILFAPGALEAAPHGWMATVAVEPAQERGVQRVVGQTFPTASIIRVKDVIGQVSELLAQLSAAIRAAASVTVAAGIAVLIGALASGARARTYDAVLLKLLGATRGQVALATLAEYLLLAGIVSGLALALGTGAGWFVITQVFSLEWEPIWWPVVATVGLGAVVTVLLGLAGSWSALSARPNAVLRGL